MLANLYMSTFTTLKSVLSPALLLGLRLYIAWIFFKSGLTKIDYWDGTLWLFSGTSLPDAVSQGNYYVPILAPELAAYAGTAAELVFPVLLALGLLCNFAALSLLAVNVVAVVSFPTLWHQAWEMASESFTTFWLNGGFTPGFQDHVIWAIGLLILVIYGAGALSVDRYLCSRMRSDNA